MCQAECSLAAYCVLCCGHLPRGREPTVDVLRNQVVCRARLRAARGRRLHARAATGRFPACSSCTAGVANGHASAAGGASPTSSPSMATPPSRSAIGSRRSTTFPPDLRLPGGRALDARACRRIQNRSDAHRRLRLLGRRPPGRAAGHADDDELQRRRAFPTDAPSARLQVVAGRRCAVRLPRSAADSERLWPTGWAARRPKSRTNYRDASPATFITADDPPMFFFHGEDDAHRADFEPAADGRSCSQKLA